MTPKEKAEELIRKYDCGGLTTFLGHDVKIISKKCALIAVDEIISEIEPSVSMDVIEARIKYWEEVKEEIEKL